MADTPEFVVVSKPAGVPAAPTVDNLLECAPCCAAQASRACRVRGPALLCRSTVQQPRLCALLCQNGLQSLLRPMAGCPALGGPILSASLIFRHCPAQAIGHPRSLLVTHRLDQCTEGLLVLGKTRAFVAAFNELVKPGGAKGSSRSRSTITNTSSSRGRSGSRSRSGSRGRQQDGGSCAGGDGGHGASGSGSGVADVRDSATGSSAGQHPRLLRKFYRAATSAPPPLGLLRHYLSVERRTAGGAWVLLICPSGAPKGPQRSGSKTPAEGQACLTR